MCKLLDTSIATAIEEVSVDSTDQNDWMFGKKGRPESKASYVRNPEERCS